MGVRHARREDHHGKGAAIPEKEMVRGGTVALLSFEYTIMRYLYLLRQRGHSVRTTYSQRSAPRLDQLMAAHWLWHSRGNICDDAHCRRSSGTVKLAVCVFTKRLSRPASSASSCVAVSLTASDPTPCERICDISDHRV